MQTRCNVNFFLVKFLFFYHLAILCKKLLLLSKGCSSVTWPSCAKSLFFYRLAIFWKKNVPFFLSLGHLVQNVFCVLSFSNFVQQVSSSITWPFLRKNSLLLSRGHFVKKKLLYLGHFASCAKSLFFHHLASWEGNIYSFCRPMSIEIFKIFWNKLLFLSDPT